MAGFARHAPSIRSSFDSASAALFLAGTVAGAGLYLASLVAGREQIGKRR
jgi:hypothetical protein